MRQIIKGPEPDELAAWKQENAQTAQNLTYTNMPKLGVKAQMLGEQGHLCAYTMQRIETVDDCHIEHIVPRNQPDQPHDQDIDYNNLLACIPSDTPGHRPLIRPFPYGAVKKAGTLIDENNFVSPLQNDVEQRFQYVADGSVTSLASDGAALSTIQILELNHPQLCDLRKAAIDERVLDNELTADEAELLSQSVMAIDTTGRISEFCLAIAHVALWYAESLRNKS